MLHILSSPVFGSALSKKWFG